MLAVVLTVALAVVLAAMPAALSAAPRSGERQAIEAAIQAVAQAASAASASATRIDALEAALNRARAERDVVVAERDALVAERGRAPGAAGGWAHPLLAALLVLLVLVPLIIGWLALRLLQARRQLQLERGLPQTGSPVPAGATALPAAPSHAAPPSTVAGLPRAAATASAFGVLSAADGQLAWPLPAPPAGAAIDLASPPPHSAGQPVPEPASKALDVAAGDAADTGAGTGAGSGTGAGAGPGAGAGAYAGPGAHERAAPQTEVLPPRADLAEPRDVSVDELLDLEQQAEFFSVLGQDDAAVELLLEHLRLNGGRVPMPYLKLLEIHRRRGERSDYERIRARFQHLFNANVPDWDDPEGAGRDLAAHGAVLPRLCQVWPLAIDALAEIEALMFRKALGTRLDLPAYRELLLLHGIARDHVDGDPIHGGSVDLLLPLASAAQAAAAQPRSAPVAGLAAGSAANLGGAAAATAARQRTPVDPELDSGVGADRPGSLFDPPGDRSQRR